jgi:hypothetical protein
MNVTVRALMVRTFFVASINWKIMIEMGSLLEQFCFSVWSDVVVIITILMKCFKTDFC